MEIKELGEVIVNFRDERDWKQFHSLKDLLIGMNIEVSELAELFLWKNQSQISEIPKGMIENELADIYIFLNYIARHFCIDLEKAVLDKIEINGKKYPVSKSYGSNKKYNEI